MKIKWDKDLRRSKMKVCDESNIEGSPDFIILNSLESDDYIYVLGLSKKACEHMCSFKTGGIGAKWCIGWPLTDYFYYTFKFVGHNYFVFRLAKKRSKFCKRLYCVAANYTVTYSQLNKKTTTEKDEEFGKMLWDYLQKFEKYYYADSQNDFNLDSSKYRIIHNQLHFTAAL